MLIENPILANRLAEQAVAPLTSTDVPLFVSGLTVAYDRKPVLWTVDYVSPQSGLIAVVGPNGAGKSTFLKAVQGLVPRLSGHVKIFGRDVEKQRGRLAYMPQRTSVDWDFPASALDVVAMGLYGRIGWLRPVRRRHREEARAYLDRVGMADFADRQIGQLSGGQQQRVFMARSLAQQADIYFMDEPFAGVDAATERAIVDVLHGLERAGKIVFVVHHDLVSVRDYFSHVVLLNGRLVASGTMADAFTEQTLQRTYGGRLAPSELRAATGR